jgi:hypothetical protein
VEVEDSVRNASNIPVRGRKSTAPLTHLRAGEPRAGQTVAQTGTKDTNFNNVRVIVDTGDLQLSAATGVLADLKDTAFTFENPAFSYGAGGTALDITGTVIPTTFQGRAVVVYAADGTII